MPSLVGSEMCVRDSVNLTKVGRTLVMGDVMLYSRGVEQPVAQVMGTYALPANG